jgi:ribosomal protein S18 acetylase RimI-like enzyme
VSKKVWCSSTSPFAICVSDVASGAHRHDVPWGTMWRVKEGYELRMQAPAVDDYVRLRRDAGLTPKTAEQARAAIPGSWAACSVVHAATGETVGMGRVLGDGGWYFHVVDMAVLPDHQRRGIGDAILSALVARIRESTPPGAYVTWLADPPGRRLYG